MPQAAHLDHQDHRAAKRKAHDHKKAAKAHDKHRGKLTAQEIDAEVAAAVGIQAMARGRSARRERAAAERAATSIQAQTRGVLSRRRKVAQSELEEKE